MSLALHLPHTTMAPPHVRSPMRLAQVAGEAGRYRRQRNPYAFALTASIYAAIALALFWVRPQQPMAPDVSPALVVEMLPLPASPEIVRDVADGPEQVARRPTEAAPQPEILPVPPVHLPQPVTPAPVVPAQAQPAPIDPGPPVIETRAPRSIAGPAAARLSSNIPPDWEALILAHLERFRRYPARARAARQQGVAHVRFRMSRAGEVLSASLRQGSGSDALDRAALETLKRAQPLPSIPEGLPDIVELTVPVEFLLAR